jgi:hypothetical protein
MSRSVIIRLRRSDQKPLLKGTLAGCMLMKALDMDMDGHMPRFGVVCVMRGWVYDALVRVWYCTVLHLAYLITTANKSCATVHYARRPMSEPRPESSARLPPFPSPLHPHPVPPFIPAELHQTHQPTNLSFSHHAQ